MLKKFIQYFQLTKWESIFLLFLCILAPAILFFNTLLSSYLNKQTPQADTSALNAIALTLIADTTANNYYNKGNDISTNDGSNIHPFAFDPNTLDEAGFKKLGLREKTISILLNYRNKGGKFYSKADVQKMYTLSDEEYKKLEPYISISKNNLSNKYANNNQYSKPILHIELNSTDTATLNKLYGIGPALAHRIVELRNKIGGFYSITQLQEVYGLPDSTYQKILPQISVNKKAIRKININTVSFEELRKHPYFGNTIALAIIKYRKNNNEHIDNWEQIANLPELQNTTNERLQYYLDFK